MALVCAHSSSDDCTRSAYFWKVCPCCIIRMMMSAVYLLSPTGRRASLVLTLYPSLVSTYTALCFVLPGSQNAPCIFLNIQNFPSLIISAHARFMCAGVSCLSLVDSLHPHSFKNARNLYVTPSISTELSNIPSNALSACERLFA